MKSLSIAVCARRVAFGDGLGGMERAAATHIEGLLSENATITLYTPAAHLAGPVPSQIDVVDVPWPVWGMSRKLPVFGLAYRLWTGRLAAALLLARPSADIVHLHGGAAHTAKRLRECGSSMVTVLNPHGMEEFGPLSVRNGVNRLLIRSLVRGGRYASRVTVTEASLVPSAQRNIGISSEAISVIPSCVDIGRVTQLALGGQIPTSYSIVTVGRLARNKGYDLLQGALDREDVIRALPSTARWTHFGDGSEFASLYRQSRGAAIPLEIRPQRPDTEVQRALSTADLFVQPSRYEGGSLTTLEAMVHGRTIVATAVGGIPDKIVEGVTGFLVQPNVDSIARGIIRAHASKGATSENARRVALDGYSSEQSTRLHLDLYRSLLSGEDLPTSGVSSIEMPASGTS